MPRTAEPTCRTYPIPHVHPLALTGHRERLCLTLLLAAFFFCLLLLPQTVRGANWYAFHKIAAKETQGGEIHIQQMFYLRRPMINAKGQVVFAADSLEPDAEDEEEFGIYRGDAGSLTKIIHSGQNGFSDFYSSSINDHGDIAFSGNRWIGSSPGSGV